MFQVWFIALSPPFLVLMGSVFYHYYENWSWIDSVYMTIITISTVGYSEIKTLSEMGMIFTIFLIIVSFALLTYSVTQISHFVLEGGFKKTINNLKRGQMIEKIENHYLVCGYGRKGKVVCNSLLDYKQSFVVIENNEERIKELEALSILHIDGDATDDRTLERAGISCAKGMAALLETDSDNVFLILSARQLNDRMNIVGWALEEISRKKLLLAGANRVLLPFELGGFQVVQTLLQPEVLDFLNVILDKDHEDLQMQQFQIPSGSKFAGKTLEEINLDIHIRILGIIRGTKRLFSLTGQSQMQGGDVMILLGPAQSLRALDKSLVSNL